MHSNSITAMANPEMYRHPTRSETIELAIAEGHDADIPSNAGSIYQVPSHTSTPRSMHHVADEPSTAAVDKDIENGIATSSLSSDDGVDSNKDDPNIVGWDGPDDPQNPMNWSHTKKWGTVVLVSAITFLTPLASSMFAPGVPQVMASFHSTNDMLEQFMVSVYVLGFGFGPMSMTPPGTPSD